MISPRFSIEELLDQTKDLPTLPAATIMVLKETDRAEATAQSVTRIILQDQALSARVLRLANSAYYGLSRQVSELQDAVVVLGMRTIRNLALVASTYPWMSKEIKGYGLGPGAMWEHALATAVGAQMAAKISKKADPETVFICALLHDLGKLALAVWLEGKTGPVAQLAQRQEISLSDAERQVLGFDHCDVGAALAARWNLPQAFLLTMQHHHAPNLCEPASPLVDCVHLGDYLAMSFGMGLGGDGLCYELCSDSITRLGLSDEEFEEIASDFLEAHHKASASFADVTG